MAFKLEVVPEKAIVVRRGKTIVSASWFGPAVVRPYVYPFLGPYGRELTRLDHPQDPVGHSHHRSIWIGHADAGGVDFWSDRGDSGRIVQHGVSEIVAAGAAVGALLDCAWLAPDGRRLLRERRRLTWTDAARGELVLDLDSTLEAATEPVVLGRTNFGLHGIRIARTMRVHDGLGGLVVNSSEAENEAGCFGQHAEWCDASGPVPLGFDPDAATDVARPPFTGTLPAAIVGVACFAHPRDFDGGALWHVRDDGWFGPGVSRGESRRIEPGTPLRARVRIVGHLGRSSDARIAERYLEWRAEVTGTTPHRSSDAVPKKP